VSPRASRSLLSSGLVFASVGLLLASTFASSGSEAMAATTTTTSHPTTSTHPTGTTRATSTTTRASGATRGPQTVLSPIGVNVHSAPSKSDKVIGSAAQGVALLRLGRTAKNGGWYEVSGATVMGWISADPSLSAPGRFNYYSSNAFNVLFPAGWTDSGKPATGVVFRSHSSLEVVVVTTSTTVAKLPTVAHTAGVSEYGSQQVVACGVTGYLYSYRTVNPHKFYADAAFSLAAGHALGLKATLTSLSQINKVLDFVNSISFPLAICVGKPPTKQ
jgi:Bacterial SH3 domain